MTTSANTGIIGVHVGAGYHSKSKTPEYKNVCNEACQEGMKTLKESFSVVEAAVRAVTVLEDSSFTNAGYGSNLTEDGFVECDASVMDGTSRRFGSVGALRNIKNPVLVAEKLLLQQTKGLLSGGRIPPSILVGGGANAWACKYGGMSSVENADLISNDSERAYQKSKKIVSEFSLPEKRTCTRTLDNLCNVMEDDNCEVDLWTSGISDTVGAFCIDANGSVAVAVSSGGILLKQPGRVGPAAVLGSGFWAEYIPTTQKSVAVCTSGCGESLMRNTFAKKCAKIMKCMECPTVMLEQMLRSSMLNCTLFPTPAERLAGSLMAVYDQTIRTGEILWAHTTESMCLGFMTSSMKCAKMRMSRMGKGVAKGSTVVVEGFPFHL